MLENYLNMLIFPITNGGIRVHSDAAVCYRTILHVDDLELEATISNLMKCSKPISF